MVDFSQLACGLMSAMGWKGVWVVMMMNERTNERTTVKGVKRY